MLGGCSVIRGRRSVGGRMVERCRCFYSRVFCRKKTPYDVRISDWSSDVCSSDLFALYGGADDPEPGSLPCVARRGHGEFGRASWRERVCRYVYIVVVAVSLNTKNRPIPRTAGTVQTAN